MLISQRPVLSEEPISEFRSRFVLEPLEPGFGYTLGNSLRRTLLSSIPGAAVTQERFDEALHEFDTIKGVTDDVTDDRFNRRSPLGARVPVDVDWPGFDHGTAVKRSMQTQFKTCRI